MYKIGEELGRMSSRVLLRGGSCNTINCKAPKNPIYITQHVPTRNTGCNDAGHCKNCGDVNESIWAAVRKSKKLYFPSTVIHDPQKSPSSPVLATHDKYPTCFTPTYPPTPPRNPNVEEAKKTCVYYQQSKYKRVSPEFQKLLEAFEMRHPSHVEDPADEIINDFDLSDNLCSNAKCATPSSRPQKDQENWKTMRGYMSRIQDSAETKPTPKLRSKSMVEVEYRPRIHLMAQEMTGPPPRLYERDRAPNAYRVRMHSTINTKIPPTDNIKVLPINARFQTMTITEPKPKSAPPTKGYSAGYGPKPKPAIVNKLAVRMSLSSGCNKGKYDEKYKGTKAENPLQRNAKVGIPKLGMDHDPVQKRGFMPAKVKLQQEAKSSGKSYLRQFEEVDPHQGTAPEYILGK